MPIKVHIFDSHKNRVHKHAKVPIKEFVNYYLQPLFIKLSFGKKLF